jgi:hypothetical protein
VSYNTQDGPTKSYPVQKGNSAKFEKLELPILERIENLLID